MSMDDSWDFSLPMREGSGLLNPIFKRIQLKDAPPLRHKLVTVLETNTVEEACALLSKNSILAVPLQRVDPPAGAGWPYKYSGMIDVIALGDLLYQETRGVPQTKHAMTIAQTSAAKMRISQMNVDSIMPFSALADTDSLYDAICCVAKRNAKRVCIYSKDAGDIVNIITQTSLVKMITDVCASVVDKERLDLEEVIHKELRALGWDKPQRVLTVRVGETYCKAIEIMALNVVSSLAVVDENNVFVGCVSIKEACNMLLKNASVNLADTIQAGHVDPFICRNTCSVGQALNLIKSNFAHAIYVVDDARRPVGVVTLRDLLMLLVKEEVAETEST